MKFFHRHRVIGAIEKKRTQGESLVFLTGPAINNRDNYFYGLYHGAQNLADTLKIYYAQPEHAFDGFVHIQDSASRITYEQRENGSFRPVSRDAFCGVAERKGPLGKKAREDNTKSGEAENLAADATAGQTPELERLGAVLKQGHRRVLIFVENLDLVAELHKAEPSLDFLSRLRQWQTFHNVLIVASISDMELLAKFSFADDSAFIGYPEAKEIYAAIWRHMLRRHPGTDIHSAELDAICFALASGKKTLNNCLRILRKFEKEPVATLKLENFEENFEKSIEEKVKWEDVRLPPSVKKGIENAIDTFLDDTSEEKGVRLSRRGLLFSGPPGTGKTMIAKALANERHCHFMQPTLADLKGEYVGQSSAKIKRLFAEARASQPTIIFIDEADTVFPARGADGDSFGKDMVNQFLQEIDGMGTGLQKIFVIAATNRPYAIDEAITSRLGKPLEIPLPDDALRMEIFDSQFKKCQPDSPFSLKGTGFEEYVKIHSCGMSGRDIETFVKELKDDKTLTLKNDARTEAAFRAGFERERAKLLSRIRSVFSSGNIVCPEENRLNFTSMEGLEHQKEELNTLASVIADPEIAREYQRFNLKPGRGILLYGSPGNGKTRMAQALAGAHSFYLFKVLSRDFSANTPKMILDRLDDIFTLTLRFSHLLDDRQGVVLFFDEIDSLASNRVLDPVVRGTLLNYLSDENGLRSADSRILFVGATNFPHLLDEALMRSGRIDRQIEIDNPQEKDAIATLKNLERDDSRVQASDKVLEQAYELLKELKEEKENLKRRRNQANPLYEEPDNCRPSFADLTELFRKLKETACKLRQFKDDRLIIDEKVIASLRL